MKINKIYKTAIVNEIKYVQKKMKENSSLEKKLFYYSAIPAQFLRVLNLEYDSDILYLHHVVNHTQGAFQQRLATMKAGDINIEVSERQIEQLESLLDDIICVLEQKKEIDDVLKAFIKLAYSISGNGYYLMEKGSLKI
ncbi:MAG TPA: hypothetical protein PLF58_11500 [Smithella sp.]|jgi:hypothetical protein|nr:hypothetical protein [Smithella sp.]HOS15284.1 hypothetical protein [Smithella sp.]HPL48529.1 hypothetical protein [Smithella sp.]